MKSLLSRVLCFSVEHLSLSLKFVNTYWLRACLVGSVMIGSSVVMPIQAGGIAAESEVQAFIDKLVTDEGFDKKALGALFKQVEKQDRILELMDRPAERSLEWWEYRNLFINDLSVNRGVEFWKQHQKSLENAHKKYGVPPSVIVGILGVETRYGRLRGGFRVIDALSTLSFHYPRRAPFFQAQLKAFLILSREQKFDPLVLTGSYAGAMGIPQFMPTSYREYAVDFDGSGQADIWDSHTDAIGSIASYLSRHGWTEGKPVAFQSQVTGKRFSDILTDDPKPSVSLRKARDAGWATMQEFPASSQVRGLKLKGKDSPEYWLTLKNFYVITRYNHSSLYAMAVHQLGQQVQAKKQADEQQVKPKST